MQDDAQEKMREAFASAETIPRPDPDPERPDFDGADGPAPDGGSGGDDGGDAELRRQMLREAQWFPLNDYGNGQRLVHYFGEDMLFVPRLGWFRYDGKRWSADEDELDVRRDAQKVAAEIIAEADMIEAPRDERPTLEEAEATLDQLQGLRRKQAALDKGEKLDDADRKRLGYLERIAEEAREIRAKLEKRRGSHRSHGKNSGNTAKISNMLAEAKTAKACGVHDLNADPLSLNCANGRLRFIKAVDEHNAAWGGSAEECWQVVRDDHAREHLISKMVPVDYDPQAKCPTWHRFLQTVQPDPEVRDFLQRWCGYSLTGLTTEQALAFLFGAGRNGKSTFVDTLARILDDYGTSIPIETLTGAEQRKGSDATPDLVRLPGARFVRAAEPEQGQRMKEALIKQLTGGEPIMIRRMHSEFVEIHPEFKLTISGNHKPEIRGGDDGIWRRVLLVPWSVQIAKEDVDPTLPLTLWKEREGILAWMVEGCLKWLTDGLKVPDVVRDATAEYRADSDPLRTFLQSECWITGDPTLFTRSRDLVRAFNAWMLDRGDRAWGQRTVSNQLKERSATVKSDDDKMFTAAKKGDTGYLGIMLTSAAEKRVERYSQELDGGKA